MSIRKFIKDMEKMLPCDVMYDPKDHQLIVFIRVNNRNVTFCYDEEFIEQNQPEDIFSVINDDLFLIGLEINTGRV